MNYGSAQGDRVELGIRTTNCLLKAIGLGRRMGAGVARRAPGAAALARRCYFRSRWVAASSRQLRQIVPSARFMNRTTDCDAANEEGDGSQDKERHDDLDPLCEGAVRQPAQRRVKSNANV